MKRVVMVNPTIPDQEIDVPEAAVDGHRSFGWITKAEFEATTESAELGAADSPAPAPELTKSAATARRTASPSGQDKE